MLDSFVSHRLRVSSLLQAMFRGRAKRHARRRLEALPIAAEVLEDRVMLTSFTVDSTLDEVDLTPGNGVVDTASGFVTLRGAVMETNALVGADQIQVPAGIYELSIMDGGLITAAWGDLAITDDLTITGAGANSTFIQGATGFNDRIFSMNYSDEEPNPVPLDNKVELSGMHVRYGSTTSNGGGISINLVETTLSEMSITDNFSFASGGGLFVNYLGSFGPQTTILNSTISGNQALEGGGIYGGPNISNSTISGNTAINGDGGGIYASGDVELKSVSVVGNIASGAGGGIAGLDPFGEFPAISMSSSLIADNSSTVSFQHDLASDVNYSGNFNLISLKPSANFFAGGQGNIVAGYGFPDYVNPKIGPLSMNENPQETMTHGLLSGSPAVDAITSSGFATTVDQRGHLRGSMASDIGAYEIVPLTPSITSPADSTSITDRTPTIVWNSVLDAATYSVELYDNLTGQLVESLADIVETNYVVVTELTTGTTYRAEVRSVTAAGVAGDAGTSTFTITNSAPVLSPIGTQTMSHDQSLDVQLSATDPDGVAVTFIVAQVTDTVAQQSYDLDQLYDFHGDKYAAVNHNYNYHGLNEYSITDSTNADWYILPNGELYLWGGSIETSTLMATLDGRYHANLEMMFDVQPAPVVEISINPETDVLSLTPPAGYLGGFAILVTVTDGEDADAETFTVSVINASPVLDPIGNQTISPVGATTVNLSASDPDLDALTYSATFVFNDPDTLQAYNLDQQHNFTDTDANSNYSEHDYYFNARGQQERNLPGWVIYPNGDLYKWNSTLDQAIYTATLDTRYYENPGLLVDVQLPTALDVDVSVVGTELQITPNNGFLGKLDVTVTVSDGFTSDSETFTVDVVNSLPDLQLVGNQVTSPGTALVLNLSATDADGSPLTYSAIQETRIPEIVLVDAVEQEAYDLDQIHNFNDDSDWASVDYFFNFNGRGARYLPGWVVYPNGDLYMWNYSIQNATIDDAIYTATLDSRYYDDPSLLIAAVAPVSNVAFSVVGNQVTMTPPAGFVGDFLARVIVSDGYSTHSEIINVDVGNTAPVLQPIGDQSVALDTPLVLNLSATDAEGDGLTYIAIQTLDPAYDLDQQYNFNDDSDWASVDYFFNYNGHSARYLPGWYILPNGDLYQWNISFEQGIYKGTLDTRYHADPGLLINVQAPPATTYDFDISGSVLTVAPPTGYSGSFLVTVRVFDGVRSDYETFAVNVDDSPPVLQAIGDQTVAQDGSLTLTLSATDADSDPLSFIAVQTLDPAYDLDQLYNFQSNSTYEANDYYYNSLGLGERHLQGWYILPNGQLYQWGGSIETSTYVGTLDTRYYDDPSLLVDVAPPPAATVSVTGDQLTITPPLGYVGSFQVTVRVFDGISSSFESFWVTVS